ncbi:MAG: carbohydrate ABC transporter permease [Sciscionella sp.]
MSVTRTLSHSETSSLETSSHSGKRAAHVARRPSGTPAPIAHRRNPLRGIGTVCVWLFVAFDLFVLLFVIVSSFKTTATIFNSPLAPPSPWHFGNWTQAWTDSGFGRAAINTVLLVAAASTSVVVIAAPGAYMLSRVATRMASSLTMLFVLGLGIPAQVLIIPLFVLMSWFNLVNSLLGLYIVYTAVALPFTVFLLTGFFRSLPDELEEAAALDGASPVRSFWQVMMPLARSGLIIVFVLNVISMWNETLLGLVFLQSDKKFTLSISLLNFLATMQYSGQRYGVLFAGVAILVLPMLALYLWLGRRIIEGMTLGAGK